MVSYSSTTVLFSMAVLLSCGLGASAAEIHLLLVDDQFEKVKELLVKDAKLIAARDDMGQTLLHIAAHRGHVGMVKFLLEHGAEVNARACNRSTPLDLAEEPDIVKLLIEYKADLEAKNASGRTALQEAAETCAYRENQAFLPARRIVGLLLEAGAYYDIRSATCLGDRNRVQTLIENEPKKAFDKELMRLAAMYGRSTVVSLLLDGHADPDDADYGGLPVLYFALDHPAVVRSLLAGGANAKIPLKYTGSGFGPPEEKKWTLLHCAAKKGQVGTAKLLMDAGIAVDVRTADNETPMYWAARAGKQEMVKYLVNRGASVRGNDGLRAMAIAASRIRPATRQEIRDENADYQAVIEFLHARKVPLDFFAAIALGKVDHVRALLVYNPALAKSKDDDNRPALHRAIALDCKDIVPLLLDARAPSNTKDDDGSTALHCAAFWGREEIAKLLIARMGDVNAADASGFTPLHESARLGTVAVARLLLAAGANVNAKDNRGRTPLSWAKTPEMIKFLREYGGM
jgi:ankyrin repeat protein